MLHDIHVVDSHTGGEPTRVIVDGGPELDLGPMPLRLKQFREEFDRYRTAVVTEPRGSDVLVGAMLCAPHDTDCDAGVIFFNDIGYLGMCGHGLIGVIETLKHLGQLHGGRCKIETPVGVVNTHVHSDGSVSLENVDSYREASDIKIDVDGIGTVVGDVAWGGNWFYLVQEPRQEIDLEYALPLTKLAAKIRQAVHAAGFEKVDHVELFGEPHHGESDSRNFVLCPGNQYDRSPCGTGTSAKLACLAADGKLHPGQEWVQEGILGTSFVGSFQWSDPSQQSIRPKIRGRAFVTAEAHLRIDDQDPFGWGIAGGLRFDPSSAR